MKKRSKKSLMDSLLGLCSLMEEKGVDYVLIGGLAMSVWAEPRATVDIDFLVLVDEKETQTFLKILEESEKFLFINKEIILFKNIKLLRAVLDVVPEIVVDFILSDNQFKRLAVSRKIRLNLKDRLINVVSPEDLIIIKMLSQRDQDIIDIEKIIEYQKEIDHKYIKDWIAQLKIKLPQNIKKRLRYD